MRGRGAAVRHRLTPTVAVDPLAEAVELLAVGVMMPFTVKPPDIPPLEMDPKGALLGSLRNAWMMVKSRGGMLKPLVPVVASSSCLERKSKLCRISTASAALPV
jgi:hypothetical protein